MNQIQITVKTLNGTATPIDAAPSDTILSVKSKVSAAVGPAVDQIRLIHAGQELSDERALQHYHIGDGATVHLVLKLRDIGEFGAHACTAGVALLMDDAELSAQEARDVVMAVKKTGDPSSPAVAIPQALQARHCARLRAFLDARFGEIAQGECDAQLLEDFKITLLRGELVALLDERAVASLEREFGGAYTTIRLRRACAVGRCINFHVDHSLRTMQVALGGDYEGGALVFLSDQGEVHRPERAVGSATIHDRSVVHGVARIKRGVRYGLFFLQEDE